MLLMTSLILLGAQHLFAHCFHLYKKVWEYASIGELYVLLKSITLSHLVTAVLELFFFQNVPVRLLCLSLAVPADLDRRVADDVAHIEDR
jgi:polysaccharide biosynthesis protein EpsC